LNYNLKGTPAVINQQANTETASTSENDESVSGNSRICYHWTPSPSENDQSSRNWISGVHWTVTVSRNQKPVSKPVPPIIGCIKCVHESGDRDRSVLSGLWQWFWQLVALKNQFLNPYVLLVALNSGTNQGIKSDRSVLSGMRQWFWQLVALKNQVS